MTISHSKNLVMGLAKEKTFSSADIFFKERVRAARVHPVTEAVCGSGVLVLVQKSNRTESSDRQGTKIAITSSKN